MTADGDLFYLFYYFFWSGAGTGRAVGGWASVSAGRARVLLKVKKQAQKGPVVHLC